jgi:hypothetical protein
MQTSTDAGARIQTSAAGDIVGWGDLMKGQPEVNWLVERFLPAGARTMLYADSGVGKSFAALDVALHVAFGQTWQGRGVTQGPVYYVAAENPDTFYGRAQAWGKLHRKGPGEQPPIYLLSTPANLYDSKAVGEHLRQIGPAGLIVYDTLSRSMDGGDPLDNAHANAVWGQIDRIIGETGATALLVHHTPAVGKNPLGARSWVNGAQAIWEVTRERGGKAFSTGPGFQAGDTIVLTCKKMTGASTPTAMRLPIELVSVGGKRKGLTVPAIAPSNASTRGRAAKVDRTPRPVRVVAETFDALWAAGVRDRAELAERTGLSREAIKKRILRLEKPECPAT